MAAWVLIPCLVTLRTEFNLLAPGRDKGADGSIGDTSHSSSSDHTPDEDSRVLRDHDGDSKNEVHALDIDSSGPWPGTGTQKQRFHAKVMRVISGEKVKWLSGTDKCRLNYVIWDGYIYDKDNHFTGVRYNGSDPHTNHAHFSGRYETSCENDTRSWGVAPIQEVDVATQFNADDKAELKAGATAGVLGYNGGGLPGDLPAGSNFLAYFREQYNRDKAQDAEVDQDLDTQGAYLVALMSDLAAVTQDPADMSDPEQHPIVRAVRYVLDNPTSPA